LHPDGFRSHALDAKLDFIPLDLSSFDSITQFVEQLKTKKDYSIDLLVNNAGLMFTDYALTRDGFEMQMGVNHLGHFKLTMLMLPLLAPKSRILTVTSITSRSGVPLCYFFTLCIYLFHLLHLFYLFYYLFISLIIVSSLC
jgi:NAD(P)-dependent dehydrogenase (short-subunit alcohol dehydrogenase family)